MRRSSQLWRRLFRIGISPTILRRGGVGRFLMPMHHGQEILARNEAGAPLTSEIIPGPLNQHEQFVVKLDEVGDVHQEPDEPGWKATKAQHPEIGYGGVSSNDREIAFSLHNHPYRAE